MDQVKWSAASIVRKLALFALIGFGVVMLAGPILAVLSVVVPFALVGFLVWGLFALVFQGKRLDWREVGAQVRQVGGAGLRLAAAPLRAFSGVLGGVLLVTWFLWRKFWGTVWFVVEIALLAVTGVGVGALVGFLNRAQHPNLEVAVVGNAIIGGALAAVAGIVMTVLEKRGSVRRSNQTAHV
jgi:hypothetical protein